MIQNDDDIIRQKGGKAMTVEERLEAIEKELHGRNAAGRWLITVGALFVAGALVFWGILGQSAQAGEGQNEIRSHRISLVDEQGNERAALQMLGGEPRLAMYDAQGNERVSLSLFGGFPRLLMYDAQEKVRLSLNEHLGKTSLIMLDTHGRGRFRVVLEVDSDGSPMLSMRNAQGKVIWTAP